MDRENIKKRGVQSIGVGLKLLRVLTDADSALSLASVASASGVPSSSCHRYFQSFIRAGFVTQDPISGRYDLGPGVIQAGLAGLRRADRIIIGLRTCESLAQATQRTAQLAIWSADGPVIVSWRTGRVPVPTNLSVGSRLPLLSSATGRAFLAHLPQIQWERIVAHEGQSLDRALVLARDVRAAGYAAVSGDVIPGLSAAAAAILDARGEAVAVIALLGLHLQIADEDIEKLVAATRAASSELGAAPDHVI